jgi:NAD(P)-dependent dehydrogenase (short-subunit alcohol dehydrogenase family)
VDLGLAGQVALVTGGAGGIGRAIVRGLREEGVRVAVLDASPEAIATMVGADAGHLHLVADASVEAEVRDAVRRVESELGPVDVLVNALGIPDAGDFDTLDAARWERLWRVNVLGVALPCREVARGMKARRRGRIVTLGSLTARTRGLASAAYAASKAAVHRLTVQLAAELAPFGITVNGIAPGIILTPMSRAMPPDRLAQSIAAIPLGRAGRPEDVATLVTFLVSARASFMTGAVLDLNGGAFMHG